MGHIGACRESSLRIGLLWHSLRSGNLGVGALTVAQIAILSEAAREAGRPVSFSVIGVGGHLRYGVPGADIRETVWSGWGDLSPTSAMWRAIASSDVVLDIGAGDSFADLYGSRRLFWICATKAMALASRRPLVLSPQTIGPFTRLLSAAAAKQLIRRCAAVFTRDTPSRVLLEDWGIGGVQETVDVAFRLPFEPQQKSTGRLRFGFNVSGLLYSADAAAAHRFRLRADYRSVVHRIIEAVQDRDDVQIELVPHVLAPGGVDDDVGVSEALRSRYPGVTVAPRFGSPSEAKSYISGLDILAGSRMHATIAALSAGVAVVPLAYSRKFSGVFQAVDYPLVADLTTEDTTAIVEATRSAIDRLAELRAASARSHAIAAKKLHTYQQYLVGLLQSLP